MNSHSADNASPAIDPARSNRRPDSRGALVIAGVAVLLLVTLLVTVAVIAVADPDDGSHSEDPMVGHIHGVVPDTGSDPTPGRVLIGAHYGLFAVDPDGAVTQVDERVTDYMAVTDAGSDRLLASGHPDPADRSRPTDLGLIESRDGGRTWDTLSLGGAADFHSLDHVAGGRTWGLDSVSGALVASSDGRSWQTVHDGPLLDVAADPDDPDRVLATREDGALVAVAVGRDGAAGVDGAPFADAPSVGLVDWPRADVLVGIGAGGEVVRSADGGTTWVELARVPGRPSALSVIGESWYAATDAGLFRGGIERDSAAEVTEMLEYRR